MQNQKNIDIYLKNRYNKLKLNFRLEGEIHEKISNHSKIS